MLIYEIKGQKIIKLRASGQVLTMVKDVGILIATLYHSQANQYLKDAFRDAVERMVTEGILWEPDMAPDDAVSVLLDLSQPGMQELVEKIEGTMGGGDVGADEDEEDEDEEDEDDEDSYEDEDDEDPDGEEEDEE